MGGWAKRVGLAVLFATLFCGASAQAADPDSNYTTWGAGADACGQWRVLRQKEGPLAYYVHAQWIQGYITAFNAWNHDGEDIAEGYEPEQLFNWLDGFCDKFPGESLANASLALMQALVERRKTDQTGD